MNKIIAVALAIIFHLALNYFLPWWNIAIASALTVWITRLKGFSAWVIPALSLSFLWGVWIMILDQKTGFLISERVAALFEGKGFMAILIPIVGCFIVSALSGFIAYLLATSFSKKQEAESLSVDDYKMTQPDLGNKEII